MKKNSSRCDTKPRSVASSFLFGPVSDSVIHKQDETDSGPQSQDIVLVLDPRQIAREYWNDIYGGTDGKDQRAQQQTSLSEACLLQRKFSGQLPSITAIHGQPCFDIPPPDV